VNGDEVKARRHAREIVQDLRWHGMTVPPLYGHMAWEFQELMRSGEYAAWVAANQQTTPVAERVHMGGIAGRSQPSLSKPARVAPGPQPVRAHVRGMQGLRPLTDGLIRERVRSEG
jgi:hypothetical protein